MIKFTGALLLLVVASGGAVGEDVHSVAQAVDEHYNHLRTLQADFTEEYRGAGMERTESGTVWLAKGGLKKPGKMRGFTSLATGRRAELMPGNWTTFVLRWRFCWVGASWRRSCQGCLWLRMWRRWRLGMLCCGGCRRLWPIELA